MTPEKIPMHEGGFQIPNLCFGNMTFGSQVDEATGRRMIDFCLDHGIHFFDTANVYNQGAAEEMLGRILKGRRGRVMVGTKVRGVMGEGPDEGGLSRAAIFRAVEDSLRRLQTDYIDLYYFHQPDYNVPIEESLEAMDRLVKEGKVRYPAVSNYASWQVCRMHWICEKRGFPAPQVAQMMYNLLARGIESEFLAMARELGVAVIAYNPLAGGLLTGKQNRQGPLAHTRFEGNRLYLDRYWHEAMFDAVDELRRTAAEAGRSLISLSLNWLLHHSSVQSVILGASRMEQLEENVRASREGPLNQDTLKRCDEVWRRLRGVAPQYNR
jgi:aryl-alcohol dehydrogenase-like predicted oxidoreductase